MITTSFSQAYRKAAGRYIQVSDTMLLDGF